MMEDEIWAQPHRAGEIVLHSKRAGQKKSKGLGKKKGVFIVGATVVIMRLCKGHKWKSDCEK